MKSTFRSDETLGTKIMDTQKEHEKSSPIEVGELAHEMGKDHMTRLIDMIEAHRNLIDEYYIQVIHRKNPFDLIQERARINVLMVARPTKPLMEDDVDLYYVNNKTDSFKLLWSLPHWSEFPIFLANPHEHDPKLIHWIKLYQKAQASN